MTSTRFAQFIARLHPAILTTALVVGFLAAIPVSTMAVSPLLRAALAAFPIACMLGWAWAVFALAKAQLPNTAAGRMQWIFLVPPLVAFAAGLMEWSTRNSPAAFAIFASLFLALWLAAQALENAVAPDGRASAGRIFVTFLMMYFAFVGVWLLRSKIVRVSERGVVADGEPDLSASA